MTHVLTLLGNASVFSSQEVSCTFPLSESCLKWKLHHMVISEYTCRIKSNNTHCIINTDHTLHILKSNNYILRLYCTPSLNKLEVDVSSNSSFCKKGKSIWSIYSLNDPTLPTSGEMCLYLSPLLCLNKFNLTNQISLCFGLQRRSFITR